MITKRRNPTLDLLRGIAALCMVLGHSFIVYPVDISNIPWCATLKYIIYSFHMELFFLLSGWVYKCSDYLLFIKKKAVRLLVPYFLFGIISMILHAFGGSFVNDSTSITDGLNKLLFHGGSYWFLYTLFIISAIYPLISNLFKTQRAKIGLIALILLLNDFMDWPDTFKLTTVLNYLPYYIAGDLIGKSRCVEAMDSSRRGIMIVLTGGFAYALIHMLQAICVIQLEHILTFFSAIAFCSVLYVLCTFAPSKLPDKLKKVVLSILNDSSRYSLQLYLFNGYCLTAIRILICSILHIESPFIIVSGIWVGNIVITLLICKIILPRSRLLSFLCGL